MAGFLVGELDDPIPISKASHAAHLPTVERLVVDVAAGLVREANNLQLVDRNLSPFPMGDSVEVLDRGGFLRDGDTFPDPEVVGSDDERILFDRLMKEWLGPNRVLEIAKVLGEGKELTTIWESVPFDPVLEVAPRCAGYVHEVFPRVAEFAPAFEKPPAKNGRGFVLRVDRCRHEVEAVKRR